MAAQTTQPAISVLFWSEPHPFRNSYTEHLHVAQMLLPPLLSEVQKGLISLRLFSNNDVIVQLNASLPGATAYLQRPTNDEARSIASQFDLWNDASIARWLQLVRGEGEVTEIYLAILERLHREQPIDVILTWSENGAVRRFARERGIPVLFGELGPTRAPFPQTMYFDPEGTNGHAAFRARVRDVIMAGIGDPDAFLPASTWLLTNEMANNKQETISSLLDIGTTFRADWAQLLPDGPYLFVPLQLADDLNTLLHSDFTGPVDFLRHVTELAGKMGYGLVVKGHPGVKERPYNLRREIEALDWLEQNAPDAVILPRDCGPDMSAFVLSNAAYTVSINSSVGFEAMILGVPALILGQAAFDAGGWLQENIPLLPAASPRDFRAQISALVSVHLDQILVPRPVVLQTDYLYHRLRALVARADLPLTSFAHANWHVFGQVADIEQAMPVPRTAFLGQVALPAGTSLAIQPGLAVLTHPDRTCDQALPLLDGFTGYIDMVEPRDKKGEYLVAGWALETATLRPPLILLLFEGDKLKSRHRVLMPREDVAAAIPDLFATPVCGFQFTFEMADVSQARVMIVSNDGSGQVLPRLSTGVVIGQRPGIEAEA